MKGHLKLLKSLDNKLNAAYASAQKSFAGRVLLKLTSEVILACLLAFAVYVATNTYHRSTAISEDNQKLKHIYILGKATASARSPMNWCWTTGRASPIPFPRSVRFVGRLSGSAEKRCAEDE